MRQVIIDGEDIADRAALHNTLTRQLDLPDWYGRNLDALYDCLTDVREEITITVLHLEELNLHLDYYSDALLRLLRQVIVENENLTIDIRD